MLYRAARSECAHLYVQYSTENFQRPFHINHSQCEALQRTKHLPLFCSRLSFPSHGIASQNGDAPDPHPHTSSCHTSAGARTSRHPWSTSASALPTLRVTYSDPAIAHARADKPTRQQSSAKSFCPRTLTITRLPQKFPKHTTPEASQYLVSPTSRLHPLFLDSNSSKGHISPTIFSTARLYKNKSHLPVAPNKIQRVIISFPSYRPLVSASFSSFAANLQIPNVLPFYRL
jgi:hypothetical protein